MDERTIARFWSKVERRGPDECWPWRGGTNRAGYGHFYFGQNDVLSHRVAFFIANGHWPEPCGLHRCDNPPCCNHAHLFEGTQLQNIADRHAKGRSNTVHGEESWSARLTAEQVLEIRELGRTMGTRPIAKLYGIGRSTAQHIIKRTKWKHIPV